MNAPTDKSARNFVPALAATYVIASAALILSAGNLLADFNAASASTPAPAAAEQRVEVKSPGREESTLRAVFGLLLGAPLGVYAGKKIFERYDRHRGY